MGCFIGFFSLFKRRNREVKASADPKQREIYSNNAVAHSSEAASGHRRATALERRGDGAKSSKAAAVLGFDLEDLLSASAEVLGKGTFGSTYKANLEFGKSMVVKRLKDTYASQEKFEELVDAIDEMIHENMLPLTAYYSSSEEKLLVYEFLPSGSLYALLHVNGTGGRSSLNWATRINIALGVARALAHIHSKSSITFHGNIQSSKILLTSTFEAHLSDYGLTEYAPYRFEELVPGSAANPFFGYRAPEAIYNKHASQKADVYSFGVLFLELLTGKDPTESYLKDEGLDLPRWMVSAVDNEWTSEVFDVEVLRSESVEVLLRFLELAFSWTARDPDMRPSMHQVITQIEKLCCSSEQIYKTLTHDIENQEPFYQEYLTDSGALPYSFYS